MTNAKDSIIELNKLANIGKVLAEKLYFAGVISPGYLKQIGAKEAFIKLLAFDKTACINQLYALEGAIQGIRWHHLAKEEKQDMQTFYHSTKVE